MSAPHSSSSAPIPVRVLLLGAVGFVVFCLLSLRIPLSSEIRYIESAREMVESGDWVVPRLGYVPYFEKPILLYWMSALARLVFGDGLIAVRLAAIVASTASLMLTCALAARLGGLALVQRSAVVLLASCFFLVFGSVLTTDPLFSAWLWAAWVVYWESLQRPARRWKWLFWACVSLAFMTKGPLALILAGGSIGLFHVVDEPAPAEARGALRDAWLRLVGGTRTAWRATQPWIGVVVLLALNLPWSLLAHQRDPRLLEFFYVRENFRAFFDGSVHHTQHAGFYPQVIAEAFVPWTIPALIGLVLGLGRGIKACVPARRERTPREPALHLRIYLVAIVVFTLLFLQASSAKLESYVMPIVPAMALLIVDAWTTAELERRAWLRWGLLAGALVCIAGVALYLGLQSDKVERVLRTVADGPRTIVISILSITGLGLLVGALIAVRGRFWAGITLTGAVFAAGVTGLTWMVPSLHLASNVSRLAGIVGERERPGDLVVASSSYAQDYSVQLRLEHRIGYVGRTRELGMGHFVEATPVAAGLPDVPYDVSGENMPDHPWLYGNARLVEKCRGPERVWLFCTQTVLEELRAAGADLRVIDTEGTALLCSNKE